MSTGEKTRGRLGTIAYYAVITLAATLVLVGPALWLWPGQSAVVGTRLFGWVPHGPIRDLANKWLTLACNLLCEKLCGIRR